ncbi:hypothetical protein AEA09_18215 [Lysinibacillus contaminans]|uniref:DUF8042 domain-containing protein n=1 Tax=Lysinibacillus contaminans TaxID=1293441 RepID=A0ABR5JYD9_9BACI|nr:hypothetical protein [Lysinibacillus contaminans]KOS66669.1 hypothetical protein AEA09_18215 [Lysinibacillus contaminans]
MKSSNEVLELKESFNDYLHNLSGGVLYIANCFKEDKLSEALNSIYDFSEGMTWLNDAMRLLNEHGDNIFIDFARIKEYLIEINEGLEKQDYLLVADIFEYEIAPFFTELN